MTRYSVAMPTSISRRQLLRDLWATSMGFGGLLAMAGCSNSGSGSGSGSVRTPLGTGLGPLRQDPRGFLDLPKGFSYRILSIVGQRMDDGLLVPGVFDGMAAFPGPGGQVILVRNHELDDTLRAFGPYGKKDRLLRGVDKTKLYDAKAPSQGGTTTVVYDPAAGALVTQFLSLAGTERNCSGGRTPWGTWLSCEESVSVKDASHDRDHGYAFEVPATTTPGLVDPVPLTAMGRFRREAAAVDPVTGIVYMTEDQPDGLFYRFLPTKSGQLQAGGTLQALAIKNLPRAQTGAGFVRGSVFDCHWITLTNVQSPQDDLRARGLKAGAAQFVRGEGVYAGRDGIYFTCTDAGAAGLGQIWKYVPSLAEGTSLEARAPAKLLLLLESRDARQMEHCDNLTITPWGDVVFCEDCAGACASGNPSTTGPRLMGLDADGQTYPLAQNRASASELAGATFSPDGSVLFVNIQFPGATIAIHGPWPVKS